ncbi:MAG: hypothetical protein R3280_16265 [Marinobacter sp.]|uniref:hypothetical protein n=1 Tax=Marinobacter sp. TaxID=50741 RepID=UPI00299DA175|nr:hypothetical protein [Marinobacter sp.]MDX1636194.1 hypothetical protein [Marinobacter sp.]
MKRLLMGCLLLLPVTAMAQDRPPQGLSDSVVTQPSEPQARRLLERQASAGGPAESELSVQMHVDSQQRIAETFRRPIPDRISEDSRGNR